MWHEKNAFGTGKHTCSIGKHIFGMGKQCDTHQGDTACAQKVTCTEPLVQPTIKTIFIYLIGVLYSTQEYYYGIMAKRKPALSN